MPGIRFVKSTIPLKTSTIDRNAFTLFIYCHSEPNIWNYDNRMHIHIYTRMYLLFYSRRANVFFPRSNHIYNATPFCLYNIKYLIYHTAVHVDTWFKGR